MRGSRQNLLGGELSGTRCVQTPRAVTRRGRHAPSEEGSAPPEGEPGGQGLALQGQASVEVQAEPQTCGPQGPPAPRERTWTC